MTTFPALRPGDIGSERGPMVACPPWSVRPLEVVAQALAVLGRLFVPARSSGADHRQNWVDAARGVCAIHMVLGHALAGLINMDAVADHRAWSVYWEWKLAFNMPVLFVLSGMFLQPALTRPLGAYVAGRARTLFYPFVLFTLLFAVAGVLFRSYSNSAAAGHSVSFSPLQLLDPAGGFWTLNTLFVLSVMIAVCLKAGVKPGVLLIAMVGAWVLSLDARAPGAGFVLTRVNHLAWFGSWMLLGVTLGSATLGRCASARPGLLLGVAAVCAAASLSVYLEIGARPAWAFALSGVLGVIASLSFSMFLVRVFAGTPMKRAVQHIGRHSLEIYALHTFGHVGSRVVLYRYAGVHNEAVLIACGLFAGVYFPIAVSMAANSLGIGYIFRFGPVRRTEAAPAVESRPQVPLLVVRGVRLAA